MLTLDASARQQIPEDHGLVWCFCINDVREGGMCSDSGFCSPERLSMTCPVDRVLIESYYKAEGDG